MSICHAVSAARIRPGRVLVALMLMLQCIGATASAQAPTGAPPITVRSSQVMMQSELHRWERHVRGFRREHNFALSAGFSSGVWTVKSMGTLEGRRFDNSGLFSKFQYSFHLPVWGGFGYLLGSSTGYFYETADQRRDFRPVAAFHYPGVLAGIVYNFSPVFRVSGGLDVYLERHNGIRAQDLEDESGETEIHVTMTSYDAAVFFDSFYDLMWALRLEYHQRRTEFQRPANSQGFGVDSGLRKSDRWIGLGLVWHLL